MDVKLSRKQRKIILNNRKNTLVIAAAGSGKTLVAVEKIKYLINVRNVNPKDILCISFTNDAVNNLKEKIDYDVDIMTFHKLSMKIININKEILTENILLDIILDCMKNESLYALFKMNKENLANIIATFINLFKSNNFNLEKFNEFIKQANYKDKLLLKEIMKCYICYETYLNKEGIMDFNDIINLAIEKVDNSKISYKYIIVDEYQDVSFSKVMLIKKLQQKNKASVFAVGDDFQSIYRFAGSNVELFTKFNRYFLFPKIFKLEKTYRYPYLVAKVSSKFINKNPYQIRKRIKCTNYYKDSINIIYTDNLNDSINNIIKENKIDNLLIIGRSNKDISNINILSNIMYKKMTIHKSKGLGFDYVFIVNVNDDVNGFPNKFIDHSILKYVNNYKIRYPYDEERRLFYVALTRCKKKVYLFCDKNKPSLFIKEIIKYSKDIKILEKYK